MIIIGEELLFIPLKRGTLFFLYIQYITIQIKKMFYKRIAWKF